MHQPDGQSKRDWNVDQRGGKAQRSIAPPSECQVNSQSSGLTGHKRKADFMSNLLIRAPGPSEDTIFTASLFGSGARERGWPVQTQCTYVQACR